MNCINAYEMYKTRCYFNFMFGKHYVKTYLFENSHSSFYHFKTIKLQCKNFASIHIARRGQSPNNRMIIIIIINFYFVKIYIFTYRCNKMAYIMLYSAFKMYILDGSLICTNKILDIRASRSLSKILSTS